MGKQVVKREVETPPIKLKKKGHRKNLGPKPNVSKTKQPWAQVNREPPRAFRLFQEFRAMGPSRKISKLGGMEVDGKATSAQTLYQYSKTWNWIHRARAWDRQVDKTGRTAHLAQIRSMHGRHARSAKTGMLVLTTMYKEFNRRIADQDIALLERLPNDEFITRLASLMSLVEKLTKVERQAMGEPGETHGISGTLTAAGSDAAEANQEMYMLIRSDPEALEIWTALQRRLEVLQEHVSKQAQIIDVTPEADFEE